MRRVVFGDWRTEVGFDQGRHLGTRVDDGALVIGEASGARDYADPHRDGGSTGYLEASWTSPRVHPEFPFTEVIPSWNATTPPGSWLEVSIALTLDDGTRTGWYVLGRWAETDQDIMPTSVPKQDDAHVDVAFDMVTVRPPRTLASYQLRVTLLCRAESVASPRVTLLGAMASNVPRTGPVPRSDSAGAEGIELEVPPYSQQVHRGECPEWDSGGASWCSPTSTSMVLAYWGRGPQPEEYAWVDESFQDRFIHHAARHVFDYNYKGAGNWPFNTAYAARFGVIGFVTRLRSLTEAEHFIKVGIPLVVSVAFEEDELEGAGYGTQGHLLTIIGFDEKGDVISNDPASHSIPSNDQVRTTYDREQFEKAWLVPAGGITYVIHPSDVLLPERTPEPNW